MSDTHANVLLLAGQIEVRGSSVYTLRLAEHLAEHGITPQVICPDARMVSPNKRGQLPIREYPSMNIPVWGRVVMQGMRRDLADAPPDLIHIQSWGELSRGMWLAKKLRRPFVLTVHDYRSLRERISFNTTWGKHILAVSQSVKTEFLNRIPLEESMVSVIHAGVEVPVDVETLSVLDADHVPVVGSAGPLEAVKGLPFFLGAAKEVLQTRSNVEFLVSGSGPEEINLRRLTRELGISDHVTFVPNLPDVSASLAAMDIFCLPSLQQGLGSIMIEAMALGKPVIATSVGGVNTVVRDNETGLVVPPSESSRLAERILELLGDPAHARAIGEAGQRYVREEFGVERMVMQTAKLYRTVLAQSESRSEFAELTG